MIINFITWVMSTIFFVFIAVPCGIALYTLTILIYAFKEFPQILKKTIKNAQTKLESVFAKILP